jgi:hypothetical protein
LSQTYSINKLQTPVKAHKNYYWHSVQIIIKSLICVFFFFYISFSTFAQHDSSFIGQYSQDFSARGFVFGNTLQLSTNEEDELIVNEYLPNNPAGIGGGIAYKNFLFDINYGHNLGIKDDDKYLKTKSFDFQLHHYGQRYVTDIFIQKYRGFYINNPDLSADAANCPDLSVFHMGLFGQYVFNNKRFSYQAAFNQSEKQLKSAGSFLLGGGVYYFDINSDSSFLFRNENEIQSYQWGINAGYAYNWVLKERWLICGSATMGFNIGNKNIKSFFNESLYINPTALLRFSSCYNRENWTLGLIFVYNAMYLTYPNESVVELGGGRFELAYIRRFDLKSK